MDEAEIRSFLERYGAALSVGNVEDIARCWGVPALVLSDEGVIAVSSRDQVAQFFGQAREAYRARGLEKTTPVLEGTRHLSQRLVAVDVRWPAFDKSGVEKSSEQSHYVLRTADEGGFTIQVAITRAR